MGKHFMPYAFEESGFDGIEFRDGNRIEAQGVIILKYRNEYYVSSDWATINP